MKAKISILATLFVSIMSPVFAGWEYDGYHVGDGYYQDDGSKFTVAFHGGFSMSHAKMKNEMGSLFADYYMNDSTGAVVSALSFLNAFGDDPEEWPDGYSYVGEGDLSTLPMKQDFKKNTFTAGAGIGLTLPNSPKWRLELAYDYIAETSYNQTPLFEGEMTVTGENGESVVHVFSTGAKSTISTDIVSAMVYHDFFNGKYKQLHEFIPYVGFGLGYAVSKTMLHISDIYGDLSLDEDLQNYGTPNASGVLQFDNPTDSTKYPASTNIALLGALGFSYGIAESTFVDASLRLMYIPKISWDIVNSSGTQSREWFSAENMIYASFIVGLRFEF